MLRDVTPLLVAVFETLEQAMLPIEVKQKSGMWRDLLWCTVQGTTGTGLCSDTGEGWYDGFF